MVGIISNIAAVANLGLKNSANSVDAAFEQVINGLQSDDSAPTRATAAEGQIISDQTNEFLNGEGGVSGFVEENFENGDNLQPIANQSLIQDPTESVQPIPVQDDSFFEATTNLARARVAFENSAAVRAEVDAQRGSILDLFDERA